MKRINIIYLKGFFIHSYSKKQFVEKCKFVFTYTGYVIIIIETMILITIVEIFI